MEIWVQTSVLMDRDTSQGLEDRRGGSLQEWATEMAQVSVFENISYEQMHRMDVHEGKWGKYVCV